MKQRQIVEFLRNNFKEEDLRKLCQAIGFPYTAYPTVDRLGVIRALVGYVQRNKSITHLDLVEHLQHVRPDINWMTASQGSTPTEISQKFKDALKLKLTVEDLNEVCFLFGINLEDLAGGTSATSVIDIYQFARRRRMVAVLVDRAQEIRPDLDWPESITNLPRPRVSTEDLRGTQQTLRLILTTQLSQADLKALCAVLEADELLSTSDETTQKLGRNLLHYALRRKMMSRLVDEGRQIRPDLAWPNVS